MDEKMNDIKKDVDDLKEFVTPVKEKVDALAKEITPIKEKVNGQDKKISALEDAIRQLQIDSAKYVRYYMFWIVAALLGTVGAIYMLNNVVFKEVTIWSYVVGVIGSAIIATLFYLYYRSKNPKQQS
ncbi:MAG: hypothetical protein WC788_02645 [Candidatus Paceibacterota bacterium]|jgi:formate-dependent nitrite reductase membrane component NrfD